MTSSNVNTRTCRTDSTNRLKAWKHKYSRKKRNSKTENKRFKTLAKLSTSHELRKWRKLINYKNK